MRRRCTSPRTMMWSRHSRRIDPISRSAKPFCQGEAGAIGLSRMPMARDRRRRPSLLLGHYLLESALTCWHDIKSIWRTEFVSVQLFSVKPVRLISDATKQPRHRFGAGMFVIFDQKNWLD